MQEVLIRNLSQPQIDPITALYCSSYFCRLRGLTFHQKLTPDRGLLLVQSRESRLESSIHMLFVWMNLAVVWINTAEEVVDVRLARSWRLAYFPDQPARYILELNEERLKDFGIGDRIYVEKLLD